MSDKTVSQYLDAIEDAEDLVRTSRNVYIAGVITMLAGAIALAAGLIVIAVGSLAGLGALLPGGLALLAAPGWMCYWASTDYVTVLKRDYNGALRARKGDHPRAELRRARRELRDHYEREAAG